MEIPFQNSLILLLLSSIVALLAWALLKLTSIDRAMASFIVWQLAHDKQDDERHKALKKSIDDLWTRIDK